MLLEVPVIDIAPFRSADQTCRRAVAAATGQAINEIGFLVITGHGVDPDLIAQDADSIKRVLRLAACGEAACTASGARRDPRLHSAGGRKRRT